MRDPVYVMMLPTIDQALVRALLFTALQRMAVIAGIYRAAEPVVRTPGYALTALVAASHRQTGPGTPAHRFCLGAQAAQLRKCDEPGVLAVCSRCPRSFLAIGPRLNRGGWP